MLKVGINGFGRIGRLAARIILQKHQDKLALAAINTSGSVDNHGWAHLFKYDTAYGQYPGEVKANGDNLVVDGVSIALLAQRDPAAIPWGKYGVQVVIESTGAFETQEEIQKHLRETVKKVVLSAPAKGESNVETIVIGVNEEKRVGKNLISSASCTTNCIAPVTKVILDKFGIKKALLTTVHAYTSDQELQDGSHHDLRRARAAAANIVPTTTGAAKTAAKTLPALINKFDGLAIRVPVLTGSLSDITYLVERPTTIEAVNQAFVEAAQGKYRGILEVTNEPIVSSDIIGNPASAIVDLSLTKVIDGDLVKVIAWYDNEWGYANRLVEEVAAAYL
ncbi:type I glyceraldehyde-3-phosphate dehydrogenase [Candidatus Beckwithbacteria bacterium RBG_13_42_9]|uniref:Glyceraldehyde-3-phosphate dehydrogenase n=1 Tax=Candidatus Beckwithbacteria bacterium RBG_13_42_9 TaxID=1797457 RepID=A0A1F5E3L7_9BACT|nr:MAG: type I glyceraldehyde-3-phosphate dehydrogenase [Candidatus Beckwithbacteria bacterium RBG_13_42_9]